MQVLRTSLDNDQKISDIGRVIFGRSGCVPMLFIIVALVALACTASSEDDGTPVVQESVHGLVRGVEAQSLIALGSLDLTDEAGKTWHFEANGKAFSSFTPSHLNEHMLLGLRVTVVFHKEGEVLVVDDVTD